MSGDSNRSDDDDASARVRDGVYDAFILWVATRDAGALGFDITITTGEHKGRVVAIEAAPASARAALGSDDPMTLIGVPCTLRIADGVPTLGPA